MNKTQYTRQKGEFFLSLRNITLERARTTEPHLLWLQPIRFIMPGFSVVSEAKLRKNHNGLIRNCPTTSQNLKIRLILEGVRELILKETLLFVDFFMTLDFIHRRKIEQSLIIWSSNGNCYRYNDTFSKIRKQWFAHQMEIPTSSSLSIESCILMLAYYISLYSALTIHLERPQM